MQRQEDFPQVQGPRAQWRRVELRRPLARAARNRFEVIALRGAVTSRLQ